MCVTSEPYGRYIPVCEEVTHRGSWDASPYYLVWRAKMIRKHSVLYIRTSDSIASRIILPVRTQAYSAIVGTGSRVPQVFCAYSAVKFAMWKVLTTSYNATYKALPFQTRWNPNEIPTKSKYFPIRCSLLRSSTFARLTLVSYIGRVATTHTAL